MCLFLLWGDNWVRIFAVIPFFTPRYWHSWNDLETFFCAGNIFRAIDYQKLSKLRIFQPDNVRGPPPYSRPVWAGDPPAAGQHGHRREPRVHQEDDSALWRGKYWGKVYTNIRVLKMVKKGVPNSQEITKIVYSQVILRCKHKILLLTLPPSASETSSVSKLFRLFMIIA